MWISLLQLCFDFHLSGITFSIPSHSVCVCPYSWSESLVDSIYGLPWWLSGKESPACRRPGFDPWVRKIPWRWEWLPTQVVLPGEFHGQRRLADYGPWGCKELDTTEQIKNFTHTHTRTYIGSCFHIQWICVFCLKYLIHLHFRQLSIFMFILPFC